MIFKSIKSCYRKKDVTSWAFLLFLPYYPPLNASMSAIRPIPLRQMSWLCWKRYFFKKIRKKYPKFSDYTKKWRPFVSENLHQRRNRIWIIVQQGRLLRSRRRNRQIFLRKRKRWRMGNILKWLRQLIIFLIFTFFRRFENSKLFIASSNKKTLTE